MFAIRLTLSQGIFLWSKNGDTRGFNLVKWSNVIAPKRYGSLGLRSARLNNVALMGKLLWNLMQEKDKLWVQVLNQKYVKDQSVWSCMATPRSSVTWRGIVKVRDQLHEGFELKLGAGSSSIWYQDCLEVEDFVIDCLLFIFQIQT